MGIREHPHAELLTAVSYSFFAGCLLLSEELGEFMEMKGANSLGILVLTTGLSKPFMRLDKYPTLLKELERHMEVLFVMCLSLSIC